MSNVSKSICTKCEAAQYQGLEQAIGTNLRGLAVQQNRLATLDQISNTATSHWKLDSIPKGTAFPSNKSTTVSTQVSSRTCGSITKATIGEILPLSMKPLRDSFTYLLLK